jgi:L-2-hydroxyglutarate oxidase LhgO
VVGGGIVGLATARAALERWPDAEISVIEKEATVGAHQSGHNSGVVHAGLYYEPGSLKARLCLRGAALLREFCAAEALAYETCGKVVVALSEEELPRLRNLHERAIANGVEGVRLIDQAELSSIEPQARGIMALYSPATAITDFVAVTRTLAQRFTEQGGTVATGTVVTRVVPDGVRVRLELGSGRDLEFDRVVVCAGLHADRLARASGENAEPRIIPFRGEYWQLRREARVEIRGLIYPVPDPRLPFLGVHLTRRVDGSVWVGPNAVLAFSREGYRRRDVSLRDVRDIVTWPGMRRLAWTYRRVAATELARSVSRRAFVREARRYVPSLQARDVVPAPAGVRAQAVDRSGAMIDDFRLGVHRNVVWVRNAPSPAATSSLAIGEELVGNLDSIRAPARSTAARPAHSESGRDDTSG